MNPIADFKSKMVITSQRGVEYLPPKLLEVKSETISRAILERYTHSNGDKSVVLAIKRTKINKAGIEMQDDPKKDISLSDEELKKLMEYLAENIEPFRKGLQKYFPIDLEKVNLTAGQIVEIITSLSSNEINQIVAAVKTNPQLIVVANAIRVQEYQGVLNEFEERLKKDRPEDSGPGSWQKWLFKNHWVFGSNYLEPLPKENINITGSKPDYLFPTLDGHVDCLDIKKPNIDPIIEADESHPGSFFWSKELNGAIGQVVNYLYELDENRLKIAELLKIDIVRPRGIIVAGRSLGWTPEQSRFYRKLSFSLHGIDVITYDHLLARARGMLNILIKNEK